MFTAQELAVAVQKQIDCRGVNNNTAVHDDKKDTIANNAKSLKVRPVLPNDDFQQIGHVAADAFVDSEVFILLLSGGNDNNNNGDGDAGVRNINDEVAVVVDGERERERRLTELQAYFSKLYRYMYKAAVVIVVVEEEEEDSKASKEIVVGGFILPPPEFNPGILRTFTIFIPGLIGNFGFRGMNRALSYFNEIYILKQDALLLEGNQDDKAKTSSSSCNLDAVFVSPQYQNQGIGSSMIRGAIEIIDVSSNNNRQLLSMEFFTEGIKNEQFYNRIGLKTIARGIVQGIEVYYMTT